ncbi:unnamed protein product [Parnassius apollo]|uniref:(apollo) hypothetical protein n=1 Tax=Parnassius apollo TaxID=110799 RepID=A0A8S3XU66_PARAO|nr:unnamed protein product [Parnassius apollo]
MEKTSVMDESIETNIRPSPDDFIAFLPWACCQLESEYNVIISKVYQNDYTSSGLSIRSKSRSKTRPKAILSKTDALSDREDKKVIIHKVSSAEDIVHIVTVLDNNEDLVQISFEKNKHIPRIVVKIIGLIIKFHPQLNSVIINQGADLYTIYELKKILVISNITDVCLDGCCLDNYDILLENKSVLRHLSLCRCKIENDVLQNIATKLTYPNPASKFLSVLNLASNRITDIGAKCLANVLRSNRCLIYLNLSDNRITDDGAIELLGSLQEFCLTPEEILASRARYLSFLKIKNDLIDNTVKELRVGDLGKAPAKKKPALSVPTTLKKKAKGNEREGFLHSVPETTASIIDSSHAILYDKALSIVQTSLGDFTDPFFSNNTCVKDEAMYCIGNNTLSYLNLAFNDLSYIFLKKLLNVLTYQKKVDMKPRGLIYVSIDGNNLPVLCDELKEIETILEMGIKGNLNASSKKRPQLKKGSSR